MDQGGSKGSGAGWRILSQRAISRPAGCLLQRPAIQTLLLLDGPAGRWHLAVSIHILLMGSALHMSSRGCCTAWVRLRDSPSLHADDTATVSRCPALAMLRNHQV